MRKAFLFACVSLVLSVPARASDEETCIAALAYTPRVYSESKALALKHQLRANVLTKSILNWQPRLKPVRRELLAFLYENELVAADSSMHLLADKLLQWKLIQKELGAEATKFYPKTLGLKEFLVKNKLVHRDGSLNVSRERFSRALQREFPHGFVAKPVMGVNSVAAGFISKTPDLLQKLYAQNSSLYTPEERHKAANRTSGERFLLQEKIGETLLDQSLLEAFDVSREYRVHTFGPRVIPEATYSRWYGAGSEVEKEKAQKFVQYFLERMPSYFSDGKAYSFDVYIGETRSVIIEINTNLGEPGSWSGFLSEPAVLGAHVRFLEAQLNWDFGASMDARLFRADLANIRVYAKNELLYTRGLLLKKQERRLVQENLRVLLSKLQEYLEFTQNDTLSYSEEREFVTKVVNTLVELENSEYADWPRFLDWVDKIEQL